MMAKFNRLREKQIEKKNPYFLLKLKDSKMHFHFFGEKCVVKTLCSEDQT